MGPWIPHETFEKPLLQANYKLRENQTKTIFVCLFIKLSFIILFRNSIIILERRWKIRFMSFRIYTSQLLSSEENAPLFFAAP